MIWVECAVYMKGNENCIRNSGQKTLETNKGVGKGTKLKCILEQCFSNIFSNDPLSQNKTCTCNHCHRTKHAHGPLSQYKICMHTTRYCNH
jgi:cytochrome c peroxidase